MKRLKSGEKIPDDEFVQMFPGRWLSLPPDHVNVGSTFRTSEEVANWVKSWPSGHPVYLPIQNSCQTFVEHMFRFLTSGRKIGLKSDQAIFEPFLLWLRHGH